MLRSDSIPARYETPIDDLQLSVRAQNMLQHAGLTTVEQILTLSDGELLHVRNFGPAQLRELKAKLHVCGYRATGVVSPFVGRQETLAGLSTWGGPAERLLQRSHEEAVRRGHSVVVPAHNLAAVLYQPAVRHWLDMLGQAPNFEAFERVMDALLPVRRPVQGEIRLDDDSRAVMEAVRPCTEDDTKPTVLYLLILKLLLSKSALCSNLLAASGMDVSVIEQA